MDIPLVNVAVNKKPPGTANTERLYIASPKRYHHLDKEYCIIFGQPLQAEHLFHAGCYFCTLFLHTIHKEMMPCHTVSTYESHGKI